ncbi:uncharacterized protein LOC101736836 isoform X2 [Bombyx mori]|uniref:Uncharacterized protein n=1 Tax=Bombyx mori TaxID=7091 RepID=A0A8R2C524_BOMMO|nr:uncharacterized protein LOC101736836 isoform X2 [Bombyx mori]
MTSTDTYQLKWHSHSSHLNGSVAALLRSERFTDVVLCTMDGSQIPAHKFILSSCSVYLSGLFEGQRSVMRMGGMLYVVLPPEISTKALKILVEYMYKGETTVSNEILDTVLKAGEVLKIRGLWRQTDEGGASTEPPDKSTFNQTLPSASVNKQIVTKKPDEGQAKIAVKKDDKLLKTFTPVQGAGQGITRPMFIGPPKLVFIKTTEGGTQAALRPCAPKGQTILVAPAPTSDAPTLTTMTATAATSTANPVAEASEDSPPPRILRRHVTEKKYGKRQKTERNTEEDAKDNDDGGNADNVSECSKKSNQSAQETTTTEIQIKDEPEWDASSIEEEERSIAEMFQAEMNVKSEPVDDVDIEDDSLVYSPLACELCAEVFTVPAAWVRHVQGHAHDQPRPPRAPGDEGEETMALLRCDLCQKHFPNPAQWVRHIQSTHTETEGAQNKTCAHCKKTFPSHASMLIHMRTHTGVPKPRTSTERTEGARATECALLVKEPIGTAEEKKPENNESDSRPPRQPVVPNQVRLLGNNYPVLYEYLNRPTIINKEQMNAAYQPIFVQLDLRNSASRYLLTNTVQGQTSNKDAALAQPNNQSTALEPSGNNVRQQNPRPEQSTNQIAGSGQLSNQSAVVGQTNNETAGPGQSGTKSTGKIQRKIQMTAARCRQFKKSYKNCESTSNSK